MAEAESVPTTSRRGFLGHVAGAYLAGGVTYMAPVLADPVLDVVHAYRAEYAALNAFDDDVPDDFPQPVFEMLELSERELPPAMSKEGAMEALRLAIEADDAFRTSRMVGRLLRSALGFFEAQV